MRTLSAGKAPGELDQREQDVLKARPFSAGAIMLFLGVLAGVLILMGLIDAPWLGWGAVAALVLLWIAYLGWEWGRDWPFFLGIIALAVLGGFLVERVLA